MKATLKALDALCWKASYIAFCVSVYALMGIAFAYGCIACLQILAACCMD